jgi:hypothetical protein
MISPEFLQASLQERQSEITRLQREQDARGATSKMRAKPERRRPRRMPALFAALRMARLRTREQPLL